MAAATLVAGYVSVFGPALGAFVYALYRIAGWESGVWHEMARRPARGGQA